MHASTLAMPRSQSAAVNSAQPRMVADEKPITESNLRFCARARVPADLAPCNRITIGRVALQNWAICRLGDSMPGHAECIPK